MGGAGSVHGLREGKPGKGTLIRVGAQDREEQVKRGGRKASGCS